MAVNNPLVKKEKTIPPWVFFAILAAVLVGGAILVGYLRSRGASKNASSTQAATSAPPVPVTTTSGAGDIVNMQAFNTLEAAYGTEFNQQQQLQSQIATLQGQLTTAQQTGKDITALQQQIAALQAQVKAIPSGPTGPRGPAGPPGPAPKPVQPPPRTGNTTTYDVKPGDTLWSIAQAKYHNGALWPRIYQANPIIKNPNLIYPGQVLTIPAA